MKQRQNEDGAVDAKLLEFLVCPITGATLIHDAQRHELVSRATGLAFPIRGGIPIMLASEARRLEPEEFAQD